MAFCALRAVTPPWCLVKAGVSQAPSILLPPPGSLLMHWALADYQVEWAEPQARRLTLQGSLQDQAGGSAVTRLVGKTAPTQVLGLGSARKLASLSKCTRGLTAQGTPPSFFPAAAPKPELIPLSSPGSDPRWRYGLPPRWGCSVKWR